jgi:hypothetical protein
VKVHFTKVLGNSPLDDGMAERSFEHFGEYGEDINSHDRFLAPAKLTRTGYAS